MIEFTLTRTSTASIETVFDAMTDHRGIADYMWACRRSTLDWEGTPGRAPRSAQTPGTWLGPDMTVSCCIATCLGGAGCLPRLTLSGR
jgi:uncharacterized protein YndB with AHSA1/START domain